MIKQINDQLEVLEQELNKMRSVTELYTDTNENSVLILSELKEYHSKYIETANQMFALYQDTIEDLKNSTNSIVESEINRLIGIGNQIETSNSQKSVEISLILEKYKDTINSTNRLIDSLETLDIKTQLENYSKQISEETNKISKKIDKLEENTTKCIDDAENAIMKYGYEMSTDYKQLINANQASLVNELERIKLEINEGINLNQNNLITQLENDKIEVLNLVKDQGVKLEKTKNIQYIIGILVLISITVQFLK